MTVDLAKFSEFDGVEYVKALIAVAHADGFIADEERNFIEKQAALLDVEHQPLWDNVDNEPLLENATSLSRLTKMAVIRDCIALASIDGSYDETERAEILKLASRLGLEVTDVENLEGWLDEYWEVIQKGVVILAAE